MESICFTRCGYCCTVASMRMHHQRNPNPPAEEYSFSTMTQVDRSVQRTKPTGNLRETNIHAFLYASRQLC